MEPTERAELLCNEAKKLGLINHATGEGQPSISMIIDSIHDAEADGIQQGASDKYQDWLREKADLQAKLATLAAECESLRADKERLDWRPMDHPDVWNVKKTQTPVLLRVPYSQFQNPDTQFSVTIGYWLKASPNDEGFWKNPDWSRFNVPTHWHPLPSADLAAARADAARKEQP